jgi:hypothetical protein
VTGMSEREATRQRPPSPTAMISKANLTFRAAYTCTTFCSSEGVVGMPIQCLSAKGQQDSRRPWVLIVECHDFQHPLNQKNRRDGDIVRHREQTDRCRAGWALHSGSTMVRSGH